MIGQHCLTHSHKLIIGKLISASNWHLVHLFNLQDLGPTLGPKSGRVEIKLYKKNGRQGPWRFELDEEDSDLRREDQDWGKMSRQDGSFGKIKMEVK